MARSATNKIKAPKIAKQKGLIEIGDSGTRILSGIIREEYNSKLIERSGIDVFDEMRKSDGTVRAAILACTLPIRAANWYIDPASDAQADKDVADFVTAALFEYQSLTWDDILRHALLSLPLGVMVFEKVFTTTVVNGATRIIWDKLAPRMPRSIYKWAIGDGSQPGITQIRSDGHTVEIPMEKLLVVANEMEGMNWWGTSILRSAYKHWYIKNSLYKIDAIAAERQGLGIPYVKLPENYTESDRSKAETILKNVRANSQAFIIEPQDYEIGFKDMKASTTRDFSPSIAHHNREILLAVLAQFLELGGGMAGSSGSRAVSQDHSQLFVQSLDSYAKNIASSINKGAIRELVDLNFNVTDYPELCFSGISETDVTGISSAYQTLVSAGGLTPGMVDEPFFRELLTLPEREEGDVVTPPKMQVQNPNPKDPNADPDGDPNADPKKAHEHDLKKKHFQESGVFKPWRALTFAEENVNFQSLQDKMDELENQFDAQTKALLHEARDTYMATLTKAAHAGDTQAIKDATLKVESDYARIIKQAITTAFTYGKNNAAKEIGADAPPNPADMLRQIDIQANAIASQQIAQIEADSKNAYVQALNKGASLSVALAAADTAAQDAIDSLTSDAAAILMSGYINHGRNTVFDLNAPDIYALQRSEILDSVTCNYCISIDGRVVEKTDPFAQNTIFHSNCRGIWVAILADETNPPSIGGIPQTLRDRFGDAVNDLIQPKTPMPKKRK